MRITFYLGRQVLIAMGLVVVALTCIIWLSQSLRFIELIVIVDYRYGRSCS